jgi:hypothetical protein
MRCLFLLAVVALAGCGGGGESAGNGRTPTADEVRTLAEACNASVDVRATPSGVGFDLMPAPDADPASIQCLMKKLKTRYPAMRTQ